MSGRIWSRPSTTKKIRKVITYVSKSLSDARCLVVASANITTTLAAAALTVAFACGTDRTALAGLKNRSRNLGLGCSEYIGLSGRHGRGEAGQGDEQSSSEAEEAHNRIVEVIVREILY